MQGFRRSHNTSSLAGSSLEESELGKIAEESFADALRMRSTDDDEDSREGAELEGEEGEEGDDETGGP